MRTGGVLPSSWCCCRVVDAAWRMPGADPSDFFNYGMDVWRWKEYAGSVQQYRLEYRMQHKISTYEAEADAGLDPDLPPELAAALAVERRQVLPPAPLCAGSLRPPSAGVLTRGAAWACRSLRMWRPCTPRHAARAPVPGEQAPRVHHMLPGLPRTPSTQARRRGHLLGCIQMLTCQRWLQCSPSGQHSTPT